MFTIFIKLWTETPYDIKIWIKTEEDRKTYEKPNAYYIYKAMENPMIQKYNFTNKFFKENLN